MHKLPGNPSLRLGHILSSDSQLSFKDRCFSPVGNYTCRYDGVDEDYLLLADPPLPPRGEVRGMIQSLRVVSSCTARPALHNHSLDFATYGREAAGTIQPDYIPIRFHAVKKHDSVSRTPPHRSSGCSE